MKNIISVVVGGIKKSTFRTLYLSYTFGIGSRFICQDKILDTENNLMGITDISFYKLESYKNLIENIVTEFREKKFTAIVIDFERRCDFRVKFLKLLDERLISEKIPYYINEGYADICTSAIYIVPSNISEGYFTAYLQEKINKYGTSRVSVEIIPLSIDFLITGTKTPGTPISTDDIRKISSPDFISKELCSKYLTYMDENNNGHFVLFDDNVSIGIKCECINNLGIKDIFILENDIT